jgi:hypothetical protein
MTVKQLATRSLNPGAPVFTLKKLKTPKVIKHVLRLDIYLKRKVARVVQNEP